MKKLLLTITFSFFFPLSIFLFKLPTKVLAQTLQIARDPDSGMFILEGTGYPNGMSIYSACAFRVGGDPERDKIVISSDFSVPNGTFTFRFAGSELTAFGGGNCEIRIFKNQDCRPNNQYGPVASFTIEQETKPLKQGDACSPGLQNTPGFKCPKDAPCTLINKSVINGKYICKGKETSCIETALGCVYVESPDFFIAWILKFAIGIGGGIAFLLMIFGVFQIITSAGDPERLKAGKELITSALIGLLMIIFSVFLLQLIGTQILQIPGWKK
jgi:hypothetical protein